MNSLFIKKHLSIARFAERVGKIPHLSKEGTDFRRVQRENQGWLRVFCALNHPCVKKIKKCEQGAAVVETAFSIVAFLILILGLIQATLVIHAKYLVNYAAYSAARAGIVHNGDLEKMKQAASLALTPLYAGSVNPADLALGYGEARLRAEVPALLGGIKVEILSPEEERFSEQYNRRFFPELRRYDEHPVRAEDIQQLRENLLTVKVSAGFQLKIPLINTIMSPFFFDPVSGYPVIPVRSTCQMRMQSDAFTQNEEGS